MIIQGQEMNPLQAMWTLDPVSRHEIHGHLEVRLEALWEAVEKQRATHARPSTTSELAQAQGEVWMAIHRLNERAEQTIINYTTPRP